MIMAMPSGGTPMPVRMVARTINPTPGVAGVPMEAPREFVDALFVPLED